MSVFNAFKGTIQNIQHDISASIRGFRSKDTDPDSVVCGNKVDLDAGADLLHRNQNEWSHLHIRNEENAKKAQAVDTLVSEIFVDIERKTEAIEEFKAELTHIPSMVENIQSIIDNLGVMDAKTSEIDLLMLELEDLVEREELKKNMMHHAQQLKMYSARKNSELEQRKVQLAKKHASKVEEFEVKLQEKLKERQKVFDEVYNEEIKNYKLHGEVQSTAKPKTSPTVDLADISLDQDTEALDEFLQSGESGATNEDTAASINNNIKADDISQPPDKTGNESTGDSNMEEESVSTPNDITGEAIEVKNESTEVQNKTAEIKNESTEPQNEPVEVKNESIEDKNKSTKVNIESTKVSDNQETTNSGKVDSSTISNTDDNK